MNDKNSFTNKPITENTLHIILESKLEPYVTKKFLDTKLIEQRKEYERYAGARFEAVMDAIKMLGENMNMRFDAMSRRFEQDEKWLSNHEDRIGLIEQKSL